MKRTKPKRTKPWKRLAALALTVFVVLPLLSSCSRREKENNMEFVFHEETDSYTLVYYTDTSNVKELKIPDTFKGKKVTAIGQLAIASSDTLEKVIIGKNIDTIDKWGIVDCRYLKAVEVSPDNPNYCSVDGVLYTKDTARILTYPNAHTAVYSKEGKLLKKASYTVTPGTKVISHTAFYKCYGLEKVELPDSIETIEERAFHKCDAMTDINFPEGLTFIGKDAFLGCESLTAVTLPSTIREIEEYAFYKAANIKTVRIKTAEANVTLGNKWYPTTAGGQTSAEIIWNAVD